MKNFVKVLGVALLVMAGAANAAIDLTAVTTYISGDLTTAVGVVGAAMLIFVLGLRGWKWLRRTF